MIKCREVGSKYCVYNTPLFYVNRVMMVSLTYLSITSPTAMLVNASLKNIQISKGVVIASHCYCKSFASTTLFVVFVTFPSYMLKVVIARVAGRRRTENF
jgi:hypothetical protein